MLTIRRSLTITGPAARTFINLYSTVSGLTRKNWRTGGGPAPLSLVHDPDAADSSAVHTPPPRRKKHAQGPTPEEFSAHRAAMKQAFPEGWAPPRKLSRDAMDGLRSLHATDPELFTTPVLAERFCISPEAVRRVLKSKWTPTREQRARLLERERRGREEWIAQRRLDERRKQLELERQMGRVRGVSRKDKLSLT
ncbi:hypothetical protein BKA93DRAFT_729375 [Sparassis latifolia]|uniref:Required for respiratory growth protein 9, mitochondrial n=1 Tax=Sparassis crispa TaxID=139825 RepID=A0A401H2W6_9APHY|nr:hypothetical protein SCP_1401480 [Sparassis crispa]GBE88743.1 hypothetical protein SCP_1401480 [Sparassis crispa]